MKRLACLFAAAVMLAALLASCGSAPEPIESEVPEALFTDVTELSIIEDEAVALADAPPALPLQLTAEASGVLVKKSNAAMIDYSNTKDGYVMVKFTAETTKKLKAQVKGPSVTYTYNISPGVWATFPLSDGNGSYTVSVYENVSGTKYAAVV
ncbi:MAG TPA: transglutaminase domain-containing protein, partial [Bacillota bacterium]|nr:transglutaminase domain-containing protein [Bacillota bacterium]